MPVCDGGCQAARDCAVLVGAALASIALSRPPPRRSRAASARAGPWSGSAWPRASRRASGSRRPPAARSATTPGAASARRSRRAPSARAQVAQATLLADGKTLLAMPTLWSAAQFSPPRWSADGGATWQPGALHGADAHYDFGTHAGLRRRVPGHGRPGRSAHGLVLPGQPLRHARRRAHLGGGVAALQAPLALRRGRDRAGQGAHAAPAGAVDGPESQARSRQAPAQRRRRRDLAPREGAALAAARLQRARARVRSRRGPRRRS